MARLLLVFVASLVLFCVLLQGHVTQAHPQYKTIVSIVVHAHHQYRHQAALVPIHQ